MQTSDADQYVRSHHPGWNLLAEYALGEIMLYNEDGEELTAGFLAHPFRELGLPPASTQNIQMALTGSVKEALAHFKHEGLERSGSIRVFCQKKVSDDAHSVQASRPERAEQTLGRAPTKHHSSTIMTGGWGYFIIERTGDDAAPPERAGPLVDLYLYREGE